MPDLLKTPIRGLSATPAAPLPFLKGVVVRAFVLERPAGNVIIYNAPGIDASADDILRLGKPDRLLVNHWHEAMYGAPTLDVPIFVNDADRAQTDLPIAGTFSGRQKLGDDLELIPTPGHTSGTTTFLWDTGDHRLLFPGDSLWVQGGEWKAVLLGESDRQDYIDSLSLLLDVDFDVLVPWGGEDGAPVIYQVTPAQGRKNLEAIIDRLRTGQTA